MRRAPSRLKHTRLLTLCPLQRLKAAVLVSAWMNSCPTQSRAGSAGQTRASVPTQALRAPARAAAAHAAIAAAVARHDAPAEAAGRGVAQVHDFAQGVGGVHRTTGGRGCPPYTFG